MNEQILEMVLIIWNHIFFKNINRNCNIQGSFCILVLGQKKMWFHKFNRIVGNNYQVQSILYNRLVRKGTLNIALKFQKASIHLYAKHSMYDNKKKLIHYFITMK